MPTSRRELLAGLLSLPFVTKLSSWASSFSPYSSIPPDAIDVVRFFNTLQAWHRLKNRVFLPKETLLKSEVLEKLIKAKHSERAGLGGSFYSKLNLIGDEILPGWKLRMHISPVGDAYLIGLLAFQGAHKIVLASDQHGVIYHAEDFNADQWPGSYRPAREIEQVVAFGAHSESSTVRSVLRGAAYFSMGIQGEMCPVGGCGSNCSSSGQCYCYNLGCEDCGWCCYSTCIGCWVSTWRSCTCC